MGRPTVDPSALRRTLGILRPHLRRQRLLLAGGGVVLLLEVLFRVLEPWPTKLVVDALTRSLGADLTDSGPQASLQLLLACGLATIAIIGLRAVCNYGATVAFRSDYRRARGEKAMAISPASGFFAIARGPGAAEAAVAECKALSQGAGDCVVAIRN